MRRLLLISISLSLFTATFQAQNLGLNYSGFNAQGEFNTNIDRNPVGFSITYVHDLSEDEGPWSVGGEIGAAMYANHEYTAADDNGRLVDIYEEDCFWNIHGLVQYQLINKPEYILYAEGRTGMTTFFSEKHSNDEVADIGDSFRVHGTAFNLGVGGGLRINLSGIFNGDAEFYRAIWLDMAFSTNNGTRTGYRHATEGTLNLSDASYRSLTDYTHLRIGLNYRIGE